MLPVKVLFSATSGYGFYYLKTFFEEIPEEEAVICGVVDPQPEKSGHFPELIARGVPIYPDMESFFGNGNLADLTVISSPLQFHVPQSVTALKNGSNVLVDKPVGVTPGEIRRMISISNQEKRWVEVGYQWSFSEPVLRLKRDILDGKFGRPVRMKTICLWPRTYAYFSRNDWAGRISTDDGAPIMDSIANNACAHFLHNMFFLTGPEMHLSSVPEKVAGHRWRAYDIQNFDTVACRVITDNSMEMDFYASHVTEKQVDPTFILELEHALVTLEHGTGGIVARHSDGTFTNYGHPDSDHQFKKLFKAIGRSNGSGQAICPPEAALSQTLCISALHELPEGIQTFSPRLVVSDPDRCWVPGLGEAMLNMYRESKIEIVTRDT